MQKDYKKDSIRKYLSYFDAISTVRLLRYASATDQQIIVVDDTSYEKLLLNQKHNCYFVNSYQAGIGVKKVVDYFNGDVSGITGDSVYIDNEKIYDYRLLYNTLHGEDEIKNRMVSIRHLEQIKKLEADWNDNGAARFSEKLLMRGERFLKRLPIAPFVSPTARGSIQMEYEKANGEYLEFEIFEDFINVFVIKKDFTEEEYSLHENKKYIIAKDLVENFYGIKRRGVLSAN